MIQKIYYGREIVLWQRRFTIIEKNYYDRETIIENSKNDHDRKKLI